MKKILLLWGLWMLLFASCARSPSWERYLAQGEFARAEAILNSLLRTQNRVLPREKARELRWKLEWMQRVRQDYPYRKADLLQQMAGRIADFRPREFDRWLREGKFDYRVLDGDTVFLYASVSNLFWRYPEIRARRKSGDGKAFQQELWKQYQNILRAAGAVKRSVFLPHRFRARFTVTVKAGAVPPGETLRCWIPIPRRYAYQQPAEILSANARIGWIDRPDSPIRSVYLEKPAEKGRETVFQVVLRYVTYATYRRIDSSRVAAAPIRDRGVVPFIQEQPPHVVFTPELKRLAHKISAGARNPYLKAKKVYNWISENIRYSYAPEYSTIPNLSLFTYRRRYGDCGQEAMLFITLCRILGVPARWQSGWLIMPGGKTIHDWAEIYLEPYGWIPVEPYLGIYVHRYAGSLSPQQRRRLRAFYFGNLDPYRYIANADHGRKLYPPKRFFRSDNVDFQRGEVEWRGGNLYFGAFRYQLDVEPEGQ